MLEALMRKQIRLNPCLCGSQCGRLEEFERKRQEKKRLNPCLCGSQCGSFDSKKFEKENPDVLILVCVEVSVGGTNTKKQDIIIIMS